MVNPRPQLLYIIGASRSGSTILDAVLGSHPGILAGGELNMLLRDDYGQPRVCACTRGISECVLWGPIIDRWSRAISPGQPADYVELQEQFERFRHLPRLAWQAVRRSPSFETYARWTGELLRTIAEAASADLIADSSKAPPRALALLSAGGFDLTLVHVLRDPRAVAWSSLKVDRWTIGKWWLRPRPAVAFRAAMDWILVNLSAEFLAATHREAPYVRMRYEDLMDDPSEALRRLGAALGIDFAALGDRAANGEVFGYGHVMSGNQARLRGPRSLRKDTDWHTGAPSWCRYLCWALAGWLARRYGYRW